VPCLNTCPLRNDEFFWVPSEERDCCAAQMENLRNEQTQLSIAEHRRSHTTSQFHLVQDLAGCRNGFDKHSLFVAQAVWDQVEIAIRKGEELSECARMLYDPEHRAARTVPAKTAAAPVTSAAGQVDLTGHAAAYQIAPVRLYDFADKLVTRPASESIVSPLQLEIGVADSRCENLDKRKALHSSRYRRFPHGNSALLQVDGEHIHSS
jgi:hypothetical protein